MIKKKILVFITILCLLCISIPTLNTYASEITKAGDSLSITSAQWYTIPKSGLYKLEVYGASSGGAGGYSVGYKEFEKGTKIYFHVGGGYRSTQHIAYRSGEMTSIGKSAWDNGVGILVAGCGGSNGGGTYGNYEEEHNWHTAWQTVSGGAGGGLTGGTAVYHDCSDEWKYYSGGSQNGGNGRAVWGSCGSTGAGAGYYSGYGGISSSGNGGSGGSGWIAGCPTIIFKSKTYSSTTITGGASGNGYARITFVEPSIAIDTFTLNPDSWTNVDEIEVTLTTTDNVIKCKMDDGEWQASKVFYVKENGTYSFTVEDADGNQATENLTVSSVDRNKPSLDLTYYKKPNKTTTITINAIDN